MNEEDKKTKEDNKKRLLLALGLMYLGSYKKSELKNVTDFDDLESDVQSKASEMFAKYNLQQYTDNPNPITKEDTLSIAAKTQSTENGTDYFKIINVGDDKVCEYCKKWQGEIITISGSDPRYKRLDQFLNSEGAHFGCRCFLRPMKYKNYTDKELEEVAMNAEVLKDTQIYRGFVDEAYDPDTEYDFDDGTLVMITPLGEFVGSSTDGKPMKEIVDEESVKAMERQSEEILLDRDHASMRPVGERDSEAMGWISGLKAITDLGSMSGLYGIIKWAGKGIDLVKERAYRFLSPVFELDENGRAVRLLNVALTNRPALKMPPIINSESTDNNISITQNKEDSLTMDITKDELVSLIKETVTAMNSEPDKEETETQVSDVKEETQVENSCQTDKTDEVENTCTTDEKTGEDKVEEVVNEVEKTEVKDETETKVVEEVIKEEALNSSPVTIGTDITGKDEWATLSGKAFFDYIKRHPELH